MTGQHGRIRTISVDTAFGVATAHLSTAAEPRGTLVLGHGAGGGIGAPDLVAVAGAAGEVGFTVVLVEQPYRVGGRSSGARVACRTATAVGAARVPCLAFPLQPPRRAGKAVAPSRPAELDQVSVPVPVLLGDRDPFGTPPSAANRAVVIVAGDHSLRSGITEVAATTQTWLTTAAVA